MRLINWSNAHETPDQGEVNRLPSKTVPGMTLSIQELVKRYIRGENVTSFEPVYTGEDTDIPDDIESMSKMDKLDLALDIRTEIAQYQSVGKSAKRVETVVAELPKDEPVKIDLPPADVS